MGQDSCTDGCSNAIHLFQCSINRRHWPSKADISIPQILATDTPSTWQPDTDKVINVADFNVDSFVFVSEWHLCP
jgi:hypothetical protein